MGQFPQDLELIPRQPISHCPLPLAQLRPWASCAGIIFKLLSLRILIRQPPTNKFSTSTLAPCLVHQGSGQVYTYTLHQILLQTPIINTSSNTLCCEMNSSRGLHILSHHCGILIFPSPLPPLLTKEGLYFFHFS